MPSSMGVRDWQTPYYSPYVNAPVNTDPGFYASAAVAGNFKYLTLGFIDSANGTQPAWDGNADSGLGSGLDNAIMSQVDQLRAQGGDVMISFGGAIDAGPELANAVSMKEGTGANALADLTAAYQQVIDQYHLTHIDFDLEGSTNYPTGPDGNPGPLDTATIDLRSRAIAQLQQNNPGLQVYFTVGGGIPQDGTDNWKGIPQGSDGNYIMQSALDAGVQVAGLNQMVMDFSNGYDYYDGGPHGSVLDVAIADGNAAHDQFAQLYAAHGIAMTDAQIWQEVDITPEIGRNYTADGTNVTFSLADANGLLAYAQANGLGRLSIWSINRDQPSPNSETDHQETYSGVQQDPYQFSNILTQVASAAPAFPASPTNVTANASNGTVALSWTASANAVTYNIYRATEAGMEGAVPYATALAGATFQDNSVQDGTTYFYTVTAVDAAGESTPSSEVAATPIAALPAAPQLVAPLGTITAQARFDLPTFTWQASAGADHYYLWVLDQSTGQMAVNDQNIVGTSFTATNALTPGHTFSWYVGSYPRDGTGLIWSTGQTFTLASLAMPVLNGPSGTIPAAARFDAPVFSWNAVAGADHYYVWIDDRTTGQLIVNDGNIAGTTYTAAMPLTPGHSYLWYVGAYSTNGLALTWSDGQGFSLASLAAPTLNGPGGTIPATAGYDAPTFSWNVVAGADHYYVWVDDRTTGRLVINDTNVAGTTYTPATQLTPGHSYLWYVGAYSTNGQGLTWSDGQSFSLAALAAPTLNGPSGAIPATAGYDSPTFSWNAVAGADHYYVWVDDRTTGQLVINDTNVAGTSYFAAKPLTPGHTFLWYIGAYSTNGQGLTWSSGQSFNLAALAAPTLNGPIGTLSAASVGGKPSFSWSTVAGADHYYLWVYDTTTGTMAVDQPNVTGNSVTTGQLTVGHSYMWYVAAVSTNGAALTWSAGQSFSFVA